MDNNILVKGKGIIMKVAFDSVSTFDGFAKKRNKRLFIDILQDEANADVCLVAYCVLDASAHFIVKGNNKSAVEKYISAVAKRYNTEYEGGNSQLGYPLRSEYVSQKIASDGLTDAVAYVHMLAPTAPDAYEFNSYNYLYDGECGGAAVIIAESGTELNRSEFLELIGSVYRNKYKTLKSGKEKFRKVLKDDKKAYLKDRNNSEETVVFVLSDLIDRTGCNYKRAARVLGINYKRQRDVMIATICDMMQRRHHDFYTAVELMQLYKEDKNMLLLDCIVEFNRVYQYSYDHILTVIGVNDFYYDLVVEIFRGLKRRYNFGFEELCQKFHIVREIISIRSRCGF